MTQQDGAHSRPGRAIARRTAALAKRVIASAKQNAAAIMNSVGTLVDLASMAAAALNHYDLYLLLRLVSLPLRVGSLILRAHATKARGNHQHHELVLEAAGLGLSLASLALISLMPTVSVVLKIVAFVLHVAVAWWYSRR